MENETIAAASTTKTIVLTVNGKPVTAEVETRRTLADFLRANLGLTGTHLGCEHGVCGACTVLLDGASIRSCLMLAVQADGHEVLTVEGLAGPEGHLHPVQQAFTDNHALQCAFCTPGFLMATYELLRERLGNRVPEAGKVAATPSGSAKPLSEADLDRLGLSEEEIRVALSGNLCRCTGYQHIVAAVRDAASKFATP